MYMYLNELETKLIIRGLTRLAREWETEFIKKCEKIKELEKDIQELTTLLSQEEQRNNSYVDQIDASKKKLNFKEDL